MIRRLTVSFPLSEEDTKSIALYRSYYDAMLRPVIEQYISEYTAPTYVVKPQEKHKAPMLTQFEQLGFRTKIFGMREPQALIMRVIVGSLHGCLYSMLWYKSNGTSDVDVKNMIGVLFMMIVNNFVGNLVATINTF